jgi:energy-converting hydrogenase Eha subunit A
MIALFQSRRYIILILKKVFLGNTEIDDSREPMRYRWAVLGIVCGTIFLVFFSYRAGMSIWIAFTYFAIYFILSIAMTRMRAELGPPAHELEYGGPNELITNFIGRQRLGTRNLTIFSLYLFFNRCYRSHPMPHQLEGFKLAEQTGMENRKLSFAILSASAVGILALFWAILSVGYRVDGAPGSWASWGAFRRLQGWAYDPTGRDYSAMSFTLIGFFLTLMLSALRMRFIWWKLHPVGYPLSTSWTMNMIWFSVILSWGIKAIILKYGGIKVYRKALPFFLGLILGEFIVGGLWNIIGQVFHITTYVFWH